jgi:hypothetical protein
LTVADPLAPAIQQRTQSLDAQEAQAARRQSALAETQKTEAASYDSEVRPIEDALSKLMSEPLPPPPDAPKLPPPPDIRQMVNPKEYEGLSFALIGMALIGGAASHGNWLGASSALNGALKGLYEGQQQKAKDEFDRYTREFNAAKAQAEESNKAYQTVLDNRKLSINEKLQQIKILAAQHGREDIRAAAEQKSIDALYRQVEAGRTQLLNTVQRHEDVTARIDAQRAARVATGGETQGLTDTGRWLIEGAAAGGNLDPLRMVSRRYGSQFAVDIFNKLGAQMAAEGQDPRELKTATITAAADKTALTQATNRVAAVSRLATSVSTLQSRVVDLTRQLNGAGIPPANATVNYVRSRFGDGALQELKTLAGSVGRQYAEAVTMPGSNAQLHATAQEWASGMINENMSIEQLAGTLRAMNAEINATHDALQKQVDDIHKHIGGVGVAVAPPTGAAPAAAPAPAPGAPMSLDDYLKKHGH